MIDELREHRRSAEKVVDHKIEPGIGEVRDARCRLEVEVMGESIPTLDKRLRVLQPEKVGFEPIHHGQQVADQILFEKLPDQNEPYTSELVDKCRRHKGNPVL